MSDPWRVSIDAGGTFTDCIAWSPTGEFHRAKVLSNATLRLVGRIETARRILIEDAQDAGLFVGASVRVPGTTGEHGIESVDVSGRALGLGTDLESEALRSLETRGVIEIVTGEPAPLLAIRLVTRTPLGQALPPISLRLATTRATNALLERSYPTIAMFVTRGFGDLFEIADQRRPDLFALDIRKPEPITRDVHEVEGRLDARGGVVQALDMDGAREAAKHARVSGVEIAAIALLHAHIDPAHEIALERVLREEGFATVVRSSDVSARIHLLARAQTTAVEAALTPVLGAYLRSLESAMGAGRRHVLSSAGGVSDMAGFRAVDGLLSGPAGGVVGALQAGRAAGFDRVISFDMGGTSTDVSRIDGREERATSHEVGGIRIARPAVALETVAAGGGSICQVRDGRPIVGPASAGAHPGPACYGAGGPLTVTDVNLLLGRLVPTRFQIPLDVAAAQRALETFVVALNGEGGDVASLDQEELLCGLLELADEHMSEAIRRISVRRGYDPADYALVAFGGAGAQHACSIADRLDISTVLVPVDASLLSAFGVQAAPIQRHAERQMLVPLRGQGEMLNSVFEDLEAHAIASLRESEGKISPQTRREASLRFVGQESTLELDAADLNTLGERFRVKWGELFGDHREREIEVESCRVIAWVAAEALSIGGRAGQGEVEPSPKLARGKQRVHDGRSWGEIELIERSALSEGEAFEGPVLIVEDATTTWVAKGWRGQVDDAGCLVLRRAESGQALRRARSVAMDREIIVHRLDAIAENMGEALRRMAVSTNVKERRDFSCGVLDPAGRLIASAPHIPVHLGALGVCVRGVIDALGPLGVGGAALTNHPAFGGSHLPDITVVQGVHNGRGELLGYVASRAHHAEIGGIAPGSMPVNATCLADEGIVFEPTYLVRGGAGCWADIEAHLRATSHPSRAVEDNLADLRAAVAAGRIAGRELAALAADGGDRIEQASDWILAHSTTLVREAIERLESLPAMATERLDQGEELHVEITRAEDGLVVDFAGTSAQRHDNLNAPLAVTRSAVAYVMRLLLGRDVPLNDGLLGAVEIKVPEGSILNPIFTPDPAQCPAVAAGNVEISQRVVEVLVRALGLCAGSQGTMNNVLLGSDRFGYYETIAGGCGAGPGFDGASAVHSHMTNTAITDPEIMEHRYPVRVERFEIRRGSGGAGRRQGGDGIVRELRALDPMTVTVIGQRRVEGAPGGEGGMDGAPARQRIVRSNGDEEALESSASAELSVGDRLVIQTPGGGGWGEPAS